MKRIYSQISSQEESDLSAQSAILSADVLQPLLSSAFLDPESLLHFSHTCRDVRIATMQDNGAVWRSCYATTFGVQPSGTGAVESTATTIACLCVQRWMLDEERRYMQALESFQQSITKLAQVKKPKFDDMYTQRKQLQRLDKALEALAMKNSILDALLLWPLSVLSEPMSASVVSADDVSEQLELVEEVSVSRYQSHLLSTQKMVKGYMQSRQKKIMTILTGIGGVVCV